MPGLIDTIGGRLARFLARYQDTAPAAPAQPGFDEAGLLNADPMAAQVDRWRVAQTRAQRHALRDRMDNEDGVVSKALDVLADVATAPDDEGDSGESFSLDCEDERALEEAKQLAEALNLQDRSWEIARRVVKYGNDCFEPVLDAAGTRVVRYKLLPEEQIWKRLDQYGNPMDPPWEQRTVWQSEGEGIGLREWQVVHYAYRADERAIYGRGILDCERDWQRLQDIEDSMVSARILRGYDRNVHYIPVSEKAGQAEVQKALEDYKRAWRKRKVLSAEDGVTQRDNPGSVHQDAFVPVPVGMQVAKLGIENVSPQNVQLQNIRDVEYLRARVLARLGVPMRYLNMGGGEAVRASLGEGGISQEDIQFARTVRQIQKVLRAGHDRLLTLHLILRGYNPIEKPVTIEFPVISTSDSLRNADVDLKRAQALQIVAGLLNVPGEMVVDHYMRLSAAEKERWFGENMEQLQAAVVTRTAAPLPDNLERIAAGVLTIAQEALHGNGRAGGAGADLRDLHAYPAPAR